MNNRHIKKRGPIAPGTYAARSTSSLKSIANKSPEAYSNNIPEETEADLKRKKAGADMATPSFRAQPFISPITGRKENSSDVNVIMAHGVYEKSTGRVVELKAPVLITEEAMANATFTMTSDVSKILATCLDEAPVSVPIQGRLLFSTMEGDFEIEANLVRVKLEESNVYAQYDRTLNDVLDDQFGKLKGPKPFTRIAPSEIEIVPIACEGNDMIRGTPTVIDEHVHGKPRMSVATTARQGVIVAEELLSPQQPHHKVEYEKKSFPADFYYDVPSLNLLEDSGIRQVDDDEWVTHKMEILESTFENLGVAAVVTGHYIQGATVTQFEIMLSSGTEISCIVDLISDLELNLSVDDLRIEQFPGRSAVGIEIANEKRRVVRLKEVLSSPEFVLHESPLYIGLGEDIMGVAVYTDILTMPHALIVGQTGSGKSVCINTILISILCKAKPDDVRLMLIDLKCAKMAPYHDIPHLITPIIPDQKRAMTALAWAVDEMERRSRLLAKNGVRDIKMFNKRRHAFERSYEQLPYIVIIIDELADLMKIAATAVEECVMQLTQRACATGIHLIVATESPTVDIITKTIKSNIPMRIAFAVACESDSRVILEEDGAENLLGYGDMLIAKNGTKTVRVQGAYVGDDEVARVVEVAKLQAKPRYLITGHTPG